MLKRVPHAKQLQAVFNRCPCASACACACANPVWLDCRLPSGASRPFAAAPNNLPGLQAAAQPQPRSQWRLQRSAGSRRTPPQQVCQCQAAEHSLPDDLSAATARQQQDEELQDSDSMAQYAQLKEDMNRTTRRFAAFLSGYLLLTTTSDVRPSRPSARQHMPPSSVMQQHLE